MDARQLFLARHAGVHSRNEGWWKLEDMVWSELPTDALRRRPTPELNSIAWLVWHMARCEDVAVNTVLRGTQEVLDRDAWPAKLNIDSRHIGTGATPDEVEALSRKIDLDALRAYRAAVWCETREWAAALDFGALNGTISPLCAAFTGILLTGFSSQSYLGMGEAYVLAGVAAVVIGGTSILGGSGGYAGTIAGAIIVVLLQSTLSIAQVPEAGRNILYGLIILVMLFIYGRGKKVSG